MALKLKGRIIGGEGKVAEVGRRLFRRLCEACEFPREPPRPSFAQNQNGKRQFVVVVRERDGNSLPAVFRMRLTRSISSSAASPRGPRSMLMKPVRGTGLKDRFE